MRIPDADTTELQILGEHMLVVLHEARLTILVDHLCHAHHLAIKVVDWIAQHALRDVARLLVDGVGEARVLVTIGYVHWLARVGHKAHDARPPGDGDFLFLCHLLHGRLAAHVKQLADQISARGRDEPDDHQIMISIDLMIGVDCC